MSEWQVHFGLPGKPETSRDEENRGDAIAKACKLRSDGYLVRISGPDGEALADAQIAKLCRARAEQSRG